MTMLRTFILGILALASLTITGCASSRELAYKQVEIDELNRLVKELEARLAASQSETVGRDIDAGKPTPVVIKDDGIEDVRDTAAGTVIVFKNDVFFRSGRAELSLDAKSALNKVVALINKQHPRAKLRVDGHTDSDPIKRSKWASNQELSEARADAVRDYLVERNIPSGRVTTAGHADTQPVGGDKAKNRRVELLILR